MKRINYIILLLFVCLCFQGQKAQAHTGATLMDSLAAYGFNEAQQELIHTEVSAYTEVIAKESGGNMDAFKAKMKEFFNKLRDGFTVYGLAREPKVEERIAAFDTLGTGVQIHVLAYVQGGFMNNIFQRLAEMYYSVQNPEKYVKLKYMLNQAPAYKIEQPDYAPVTSVLFSPAVTKSLFGKLTEIQAVQVASRAFSASFYNILKEQLKEDITLSVDAELDILEQKLDKEIVSSSQLEMLSRYTDLSVMHRFDHVAAVTVGNTEELMFILPSCQFAELSIGVSSLRFLNGKKLARFTYQGDVYSFSYTPSIQTDATGKVSDGGSLPNMQGRFLPFEKMQKAIEAEKQLPDLYNEKNQFRYSIKKGETIYYDIAARWVFSGIELTTCASERILVEGNTLVPILDCAAYIKQCESEGESSAANGAAYASGSVSIIDYTKDAAGVSLVSPEEIKSIGLSLTEWNDKLGFNAKVYLLCKQDKSFQAHFSEANQDASPGRIIIVIDGTKEKHSIELQHKFKIPDWISNVLPAGNTYSNEDNCITEYINTGLTALHSSSGYKSEPLFLQIKQEYGLALYRGLFGMLYCMTNEASAAGKGAAMKFVAGGLNELIASVDLAQMVEGLAHMAKGAASNIMDAHVGFVLDQKQTFEEIKSGRSIPSAELVARMMSPSSRMQSALISTAIKVSADLVKFYFTECESDQQFGSNMCPYRYGQVAVMVIPVVLTAGEWAFVKSGHMLARLKVFKNIQKADEVAKLLKNGGKAEVTVGKIIINNGEEIITIQKVKDDVVVRKEALNAAKIGIKWFDDLPARLKADIGDVNSDLGKFFDNVTDAKRIKFVNAWKKLDDAGLVALKRDPNWLEKVTNWTDKGLELTNEGKILNNGSEVGKIIGDRLHVKYSGYGGDIICDPNKTTTLLGKWKDPSCGGTCEIIDSRLSKSGQSTGGVNVLSENVPTGWTDQQIWDNVNEPWLRAAANRDDIIRVISDPLVPSNIYKPDGTASFFGREHELLTKPISQGGLGFTYNPSIFSYVK